MESNDLATKYFDSLILLIIGIIFFLVFVIQMTIFDFYKKPSIYELELCRELKNNNTNNNCVRPGNNNRCPSSTSKKIIECNDDENEDFPGQTPRVLKNKNIYRDILFFVVYLNIIYFLSLSFSDAILTPLGVIIIIIMLYFKYYII